MKKSKKSGGSKDDSQGKNKLNSPNVEADFVEVNLNSSNTSHIEDDMPFDHTSFTNIF